MPGKAPGKAHRTGISLEQITAMFPDDDAARAWFERHAWPEGPRCPRCGSVNVQTPIRHRTMTHRCRACPNRPQFSLRTGTVMEGTKIGYRAWAISLYLLVTNLKGISSMKLHRDLGITQKSAWHLAHRIRKALESDGVKFDGPVEFDETYIGGKRRNMSNAKRRSPAEAGVGRGPAGKTAVVGARDRKTNRVSARAVKSADKETLQGFVAEHAAPNAKIYTDEAGAYAGMPFDHESVNHSARECVRDEAHTNGIESFWALLKRGYHGTFHHISVKHLDLYVTEFAERSNVRERDTIEQMAAIAAGMVGKRLRHADLVGRGKERDGARAPAGGRETRFASFKPEPAAGAGGGAHAGIHRFAPKWDFGTRKNRAQPQHIDKAVVRGPTMPYNQTGFVKGREGAAA